MTEEITTKINDFFAKYRLRSYAKGQILILNGDQTNYIYHLVAGKVKQYDVTYRGDEVILNIFQPPAFFPMSLAINNTANPYIYEAETDIQIRQAPAGEVVAFIKNNPDVMYDLLSRVYKGTDALLGRLAHMMAGSAKSRLLYELVLEGRRFGTMHDNGDCSIDIHEKDLAARAGLSRETISREVHKLKAEKIIKVGSKNIVIKNLAKLEQQISQEV